MLASFYHFDLNIDPDSDQYPDLELYLEQDIDPDIDLYQDLDSDQVIDLDLQTSLLLWLVFIILTQT